MKDWWLKREGKRTIGRLMGTFEDKVNVVKEFPQTKKRVLEDTGKIIRIFIKRHSG